MRQIFRESRLANAMLWLAAGLAAGDFTSNRVSAQEYISLGGRHSGRASVFAVAFSRDGKRVASGSIDRDDNGLMSLWDLPSRKETAAIRTHGKAVMALDFSRDGKLLASAGEDGKIRIWDAVSIEQRAILNGQTGIVLSIAFSPDGKMLASGSGDKTVCLWNLATMKRQMVLRGHKGQVWRVTFSPDGLLLATVSARRSVKLWNVTTGQQRAKQIAARKPYCVAFSHDGKLLATGGYDGGVELFDVTSGKRLKSLQLSNKDVQGPQPFPARATVWDVAFSPDDQYLAIANSKFHQSPVRPFSWGEITLWDLKSPHPKLVLKGHLYRIYAIAFSPSGKNLVSSDSYGAVRLWNIEKLLEGSGNQ